MTPVRHPRLLVVVNVYEPDLGGGVVFADLCEGLAERGFDVTVRCAVPYYPEWRDKSESNGWQIHRSKTRGVLLERYGLYIPGRPNRLVARLAYEASFFFSLLRSVPNHSEFDAVMVFCPLVGSVAYGWVAARASDAPLWLNVQDLSAEAAAASGIVRGRSFARLMIAVQRFLFNRADVWSTISPIMADRLASLRIREQPVHILPNWLHRTLAAHVERCPDRPGFAPGRPVRLLYSGNIGTKQDLLRFCRIIHDSEASFDFLIRGGGGRAPDVRAWVESTGDPRFRFEDLTSESGLVAALTECDLFVITETEHAGGSFIPSKLLPAMATATPVLAICDPASPLGHEMTESGMGPLLQWHDLPKLPDLLADLATNPDVLATWSARSRARATRYDRTAIIDRYADLLQDLIAQTETPTRS